MQQAEFLYLEIWHRGELITFLCAERLMMVVAISENQIKRAEVLRNRRVDSHEFEQAKPLVVDS